jgi:hypothetical protein
MSKRTAEQIRSHSQKYVIKLIKKHSIKKVILIIYIDQRWKNFLQQKQNHF